jgi:hypothetical protein
VHRGRITQRWSRVARWAAVESVRRIGAHTVVGGYEHQVADRRGKNVGTVTEHPHHAARHPIVRTSAYPKG